MKRFDRAMYAFFLLALLADVARANVPAPVGADSSGGLMLSAASQFRVGATGAANPVLRRSVGSFRPVARFKSFGVAFSGWARILSGQFDPTNQSNPGMLSVLASLPGSGSGTAFVDPFKSASPALAILEHTGSPAP